MLIPGNKNEDNSIQTSWMENWKEVFQGKFDTHSLKDSRVDERQEEQLSAIIHNNIKGLGFIIAQG